MGTLSDTTCSKCGKRFGWAGNSKQRPPCPRCGYIPTQETLDQDDETLQEFFELLAERPTSNQHQPIRVRQRQIAGLSLNQAARLLGVTRSVLEAIEAQTADPLPWLQQKIIQVYGLKSE